MIKKVKFSKCFSSILSLLFVVFSTFISFSQTTVTYVMQDANFPTQFNDGGDFFNNGSTELGMWANSGNKNTAGWRVFKTAGDNTGTNRPLRIGDVFVITVAATRAVGQIGFSLNAGGTSGTNYTNRTSGSRMYFNTDNYAAWYVNRSGGNSSLSYVPIQNTYKDYRFTIKITSSTTADVFLTVDGTDYRAYNITLNGTGNIDTFCIYGSNMNDGDSNDDAYWKQTATVTNSGTVELGYFLNSGTYTPGVISNGLAANSTTTVSVNNINVGGDAGSAVVLSQDNDYTGTTTVNANATLRLGKSSTSSSFGPLGTSAGLTTVSLGGVLDLGGYSLTSSANETFTINGTGISGGGALINSSVVSSTLIGAISLGSNSSIGGSGPITLSGLISGANSLTKVGAGTVTLSNASNSYSGGTIISAGTITASAAVNLGSTSGPITLGNGSTTGTLNITASFARIAINVTDASSAGVINVASGQTFTLINLNTASGTNNTTKIGKSGPGTLSLSGAGTYVGQTQIGEGSVIVSNGSGLGTNTSTSARGIDLGLNVGDVSQANNVSVLATTGITVPQSIYVAPNTSSATRTIGLSGGSGTATFSNEIYLDGNLTVSGTGTVILTGRLTNTGGLISSAAMVTLGHNANNYSGTTTVNSGSELRLNPSSTGATFASPIVLNGGILSTTSIVTNRTITSSSTLGLTASSTLQLSAAAHTLTFAASNGVSWTASSIITITGWQGSYDGTAGTAGRIFIGNSSTGLTSTQLSQITFFNGTSYFQATLLSTGELVPTATIAAFYWGGSGTWDAANKWSLTSGGALNQTWISGRDAVFNVASSTITGATTNVSSITATENVTFTAGGTLAFGASGTGVAPISVASGKLFNLGGQALTTSATAGYIKNGAGTLQLAGGTFSGGVTINDGMIAAGGVNAMGAGGTLTINGGTIAGTGNRTFTGKYSGGITIGGDFTLGSSTSPASGTATLLFDNVTSLGSSSSRTITLGGTGVISWNGIISGSGSNLTVNGSAVGTLSLGAANTYSGSTTIGTNATLRLGATNAIPVGGAGLILNGGTLSTGATTGFSVGSVSTNAGTLNLAANSTINLGSGSHSLYFAASNGVTWNGSTLTVTGWTGNDGESGTAGKIFVGNSASGLTSGQLAKITINSKAVTQLSTGEIVPRATIYRSAQTGNWSSTSTWERSLDDGANWIAAIATPTSADGTITIKSTHTVTLDAAITIDQTTVENGATVIHSSANTITIADGVGTDLSIDGVWRRTIVANTISINSGATIIFGSAGEYEHAVNGGSLPIATWSSGSTLRVTGFTAATSFSAGIGQAFSNVIWNCTSQAADVIIEPASTSITGQLTILSTGSGTNILAIGNTSTTRTLTVGSLQVSGGRLAIAGASASAAMNLNVTGNCLIDGGSLQVSRTISSANTLTVNGTTTLSSGTFYIQNAGVATANSNVNSAILIGNVTINGGTLDLVPTANDLGPGRVFVRGDLTLSSGAIQNTRNINTGTSGIYFDGSVTQTFTHSGGTLSTSTGGVGRRFFYKTSSGPTINEVYNASTAQTSVNGSEPTSLGVSGYASWPTSGSTINNLTINNSAGVTLSAAKQINGALTLTSGKLTTNGNALTLVNNTTGSSSSYIVADATGTVTMNGVSSAKTIPLGTATSYAPITLSAGSSTNYATYVSSTLACSPTDATKVISLAWGINGSNVPSSVVFQWNGSDNAGGLVIGDNLELGRATCPTYVGTTIGAASGSNPYTLSVSSGLASGNQVYSLGNVGSLKPGDPVVFSSKSTLTALTTTYGTASSTDNFNVSGASLTSDITVTAPTGFEISKTSSSSGFADSHTLTQSGGIVSSTVIYIRLKSTATVVGTYDSQNVTIASTGATTVNVQTAATGNTVSPKALNITGVSAASKQYDGNTTVNVTANPVFSGLENGESFSVTGSPTWAFTTKTVGLAKSITQTGSYSSPSTNYSVNQPSLTADITAINLTVTGSTAQNKVYDGTTTAAITGSSLIGVIGGDVVTVGGGGIFASSNVANGINVTSSLTLGGADGSNYTLTHPTGLSANITIADQTITFGALADKTTSDSPFALGATASSGLTVSYTSSNTSVATVSGNTVTIVGVGTTTITASQAGNSNYNAATSVDQTLNVTLSGFYWNGGNTAANPANGGTGNWGTSNAWRQPSSSGSAATWSDGNTAILSGSAGNLDLSASRTFSDLHVLTTDYSIFTTSSITLTGDVNLNDNVNLKLFNNSTTGNTTLSFQGNISGGTDASLTLRATATSTSVTRMNLGNSSSASLSCTLPITITGSGYASLACGGTGSSATSLFSGNITGNGNRLNIGATGGYNLEFSGKIDNGSGDVRFAAGSTGGVGTLILSGNGNLWGSTLFELGTSGIVKMGRLNALPTSTSVVLGNSSTIGGVFDLNGFNTEVGSISSGAGNGSITNNGGSAATLTIGGSSSPSAMAFVISNGSGGISLTRTGTGTTILTGQSNYTGLTTISGGTLQLNRTGGTTIPSGNNVLINGGVLQISKNQTLNNVTVTSGTLRVDSGVTLTINGTFTGGGAIENNGTIVIVGPSAFPGTSSTVSAMNNLTINRAGGVTLDNSITVSGALTLTSGTLSVGANTLTLSGTYPASNINNILTTSASTLVFNCTGSGPFTLPTFTALGSLTINSASQTYNLNSNPTISGNLTLTNGTLGIGARTLTYSGSSISRTSGLIDASNASSSLIFTNSSALSLPTGLFTGSSISYVTLNCGGLNIAEDLQVKTTLTMTQGNITISSGKLEIGTSKTNTGTIEWTDGTIIGPLKRWFGTSANSTQASGIFPVGTSLYNRYAQINFTESTPGGYLIINYIDGTPANAYDGLPFAFTENSANKFIQNADEDGYWDMTPYSESGVAYGALDDKTYDLYLRINNPASVQNGGILANPPGVRLIRAKGHADGSHDEWSMAGTHSVTQAFTVGEDYKVGAGGVVGFSWFNGGGDNQNPLPVELLSFNGVCNLNSIDLNWKTASEHNSAYFEIEKSSDGANWRRIQHQESVGNSTELVEYIYEDFNKNEEDNYYRLTQVDENGAQKIYDPILVNCNENSSFIKTYPNPSNSTFQLVVNDKAMIGKAIISIIDTHGTEVGTMNVEIQSGVNTFLINEKLNTGLYFVQITNSNSSKVVKQSIR
jgi:autotransporter-associated beta strand protein